MQTRRKPFRDWGNKNGKSGSLADLILSDGETEIRAVSFSQDLVKTMQGSKTYRITNFQVEVNKLSLIHI